MTKNTYNGWTNRETWVINLHFLDGGTELDTTIYSYENWLEFEEENGTEQEYEWYKNREINRIADLIKEEVEYAYEQAEEMCDFPMWITDLINLGNINWWELAKNRLDID